MVWILYICIFLCRNLKENAAILVTNVATSQSLSLVKTGFLITNTQDVWSPWSTRASAPDEGVTVLSRGEKTMPYFLRDWHVTALHSLAWRSLELTTRYSPRPCRHRPRHSLVKVRCGGLSIKRQKRYSERWAVTLSCLSFARPWPLSLSRSFSACCLRPKSWNFDLRWQSESCTAITNLGFKRSRFDGYIVALKLVIVVLWS